MHVALWLNCAAYLWKRNTNNRLRATHIRSILVITHSEPQLVSLASESMEPKWVYPANQSTSSSSCASANCNWHWNGTTQAILGLCQQNNYSTASVCGSLWMRRILWRWSMRIATQKTHVKNMFCMLNVNGKNRNRKTIAYKTDNLVILILFSFQSNPLHSDRTLNHPAAFWAHIKSSRPHSLISQPFDTHIHTNPLHKHTHTPSHTALLSPQPERG